MGVRIRRHAVASWQGVVDTGDGQIALGSGAFKGPYSLRSRIADERQTNPEELMGAALAGCFAMSLANSLSRVGQEPRLVTAKAVVTLEQTDAGYTVTRIDLAARGFVPGLDEVEFVRLAEQTKATCPISRALAGTEITLDARLEMSIVGTELARQEA
jgi:osmotically inducible protein OsmC